MKVLKRVCSVLICLGMVLASLTTLNVKAAETGDYSNAVSLPMNGSWTSDLYLNEETTGDEKWYKVVIPTDGCLNLKIMKYWESLMFWNIYTADLSQNPYGENLYGGTDTSPSTDYWNIPLSAGTYYLKLTYYGDGGKYKMCNSFSSYGVNDTAAYSYDSPQSYTVGTQIVGALANTDEEDWFKFTIAKAQTVIFKISQYFGNQAFFTIFNQDLTQKVKSDSVYGGELKSPKSDTWEVTLDKGTYYLKFDKYGWGGKYIFSMNTLTKDNCTHDLTSEWHDATYFAKGYRQYTCKKCGYTYKADYEAVKKLSEGYLSDYSYVGKGSLKLQWSTVTDASGYQIRYSKSKKMKSGVKIVKVKGQSKYKKTIKKLSRKKKYYVQIRAYKTSGKKTVYGKWSSKKSWKTR